MTVPKGSRQKHYIRQWYHRGSLGFRIPALGKASDLQETQHQNCLEMVLAGICCCGVVGLLEGGVSTPLALCFHQTWQVRGLKSGSKQTELV